MSRRGAGVVFCFLSGILFSARFIAAAIYMSNFAPSERGEDLFNRGLLYVGSPLLTLSILALIIGIGYLIWAEVSKKNPEQPEHSRV